MKLEVGVRLLCLLTTRPENALTTSQIQERWTKQGGPQRKLRTFQRYMAELCENHPTLVVCEKSGPERAYYLKSTEVATWFMSEEAALDLQLRRDVFGHALGEHGEAGGQRLRDLAEQMVAGGASAWTKRIRDRLRIVPDGIGRLPATIDKEVLRAFVEAIGKDRMLKFSFRRLNQPVSNYLVSPLGLVAKDGTIYLVAATGLADAPRTFALHRVTEATVHFQQAQPRPDFCLDDHIRDTHQFSHPLNPEKPPFQMKVRVAPETIYHFHERPLSEDQLVTEPAGTEPWYVVTATVPWTILLVPFLVSMGPWIEVVAPPEIRAETAKWVAGIAAHYADISPGQ